VGGVVSHLSAALLHGWPVKTVPDVTWVTLPRRRGALRVDVGGVHVHHSDLSCTDHEQRVTTALRTVLDCARTLPFDEALAVADSALRSRKVARAELREAAAHARGPGSAAIRRVADHAHPGAANPLESVLRALTIEVGLAMTPQLEVAESGMYAKVDLGNEKLRLIIEAEGYGTHGTRKGLRRDCRRHTEFAVFGWVSLRYAYEDVMFEQDWVRWSLRAWQATLAGRVPARPPRRAG
jgi:very-short-patch-repair endonuclease